MQAEVGKRERGWSRWLQKKKRKEEDESVDNDIKYCSSIEQGGWSMSRLKTDFSCGTEHSLQTHICGIPVVVFSITFEKLKTQNTYKDEKKLIRLNCITEKG